LLLPKFLKTGDKAALIAPSGAQPQERMESAVKSVEGFGLKPLLFPCCTKQYGYLAGTDAERARDLTDAFSSPDIKAVICIRGGYGAQRLLDLVDFDAIAASGKPLYGYSDITALHIEMNRRGVVSWHTPMPGTEWYKGLDLYTNNALKAALFGPLPNELANPENTGPIMPLTAGKAEGVLIGGNLTVLASSVGTSNGIDVKGKIIFLEDVDESPYRIDRMLLQLKRAGVFDGCAGVIFGTFTGCEPADPAASLSVGEILYELAIQIKKPVVTGFQCGHTLPTACLPLGAAVSLDAGRAEIKILGVP